MSSPPHPRPAPSAVVVIPLTIHPTSSCSQGWRPVVVVAAWCWSPFPFISSPLAVIVVPPTIHPTSGCSRGWRWVVCHLWWSCSTCCCCSTGAGACWVDSHHLDVLVLRCGGLPVFVVIPPVIHPMSSCSWGWGQVVCHLRALPAVVISPSRLLSLFPLLTVSQACSTPHTPCEQWLAAVVGGVAPPLSARSSFHLCSTA
jgi:hypothetical protein